MTNARRVSVFLLFLDVTSRGIMLTSCDWNNPDDSFFFLILTSTIQVAHTLFFFFLFHRRAFFIHVKIFKIFHIFYVSATWCGKSVKSCKCVRVVIYFFVSVNLFIGCDLVQKERKFLHILIFFWPFGSF